MSNRIACNIGLGVNAFASLYSLLCSGLLLVSGASRFVATGESMPAQESMLAAGLMAGALFFMLCTIALSYVKAQPDSVIITKESI